MNHISLRAGSGCYLLTAMAPPSTRIESIAYSISGTSFFLDVVFMIPHPAAENIEHLAVFQETVSLLFYLK
ncbi:hypothetical protein [Dysosmobacter sp.]